MSEQEVDFLEVDQPIPGQNYVCLSFISPEKVLKQKEVFFMKKFMHELLTNEKKKEYFLNMDPEKLTYEKVDDMIEDFRITNEKQVYDEFDESVDFQTSVRGLKIRGVYDTLKEAKVRASILQKRDPKFSVFIAQCGYWVPYDPTTTDEIDSEYQERQLNELMKNYKINAEERDMFYQEEKQRKVDQAIKENLEKKQQLLKENTELKEPQVDAKENIGELREILDEKDRLFRGVLDKANVNKQLADGGKLAALEENTDEDVKPDDEFSSGKFSDPWMRRKEEGEQELPTPNGEQETISHNADDVAGENNDNLKEITKNIF